MVPVVRAADTALRWHRYARNVGYRSAVNSAGQRLRGEIRVAQLRLIRRWSPVVAMDADGLRIFVSTRDAGVARQFVLHGAYEAGPMIAAMDVLSSVERHPFRGDSRTFLDIGANIGTAIVQAICHHGASGGVAFEPDPANLSLLRHNILANQLTDRVAVVSCALTDSPRDVMLERSSDNHGDHRVRVATAPRQDAFGESGRAVVTVRGLTLDSQVDTGVVDLDRVGLVSIDTQGHEAHVLAGATQLCGSEVPVMLEYWPYGLQAAGGRELFEQLVTTCFHRYVDLAHPFEGDRVAARPTGQLASLDEQLGDIGWANILLLSR